MSHSLPLPSSPRTTDKKSAPPAPTKTNKQDRGFPGGPSNAGGGGGVGWGGDGSIPGWGAKILHASQPKNQNMKQKQCCNKMNKDFKNGLRQRFELPKMTKGNQRKMD